MRLNTTILLAGASIILLAAASEVLPAGLSFDGLQKLNYAALQAGAAVRWQDQQGHAESVQSLCFTRDGEYLVSADYAGAVRVWHVRTGAVVFSSSRGYEFSYEPIDYSEKENGYFTAAVLQALKGAAADSDKDGIVFLDELEVFVQRNVSARSNGLQNPTVDRDNISIRFGFPAGSEN